ncbi:MAG: TonB C-terminal domain-containing protein [Polyangiaceae bacterium]
MKALDTQGLGVGPKWVGALAFLLSCTPPPPVRGNDTTPSPAESGRPISQPSKTTDQPSAESRAEVEEYERRLRSFFARGFRVHGLGLPAAEMTKLKAEVSVALDEEQIIVSYEVLSASGNTTFDHAVHQLLSSKVGKQVPPPPPGRLDLRVRAIRFLMVCGKGCD